MYPKYRASGAGNAALECGAPFNHSQELSASDTNHGEQEEEMILGRDLCMCVHACVCVHMLLVRAGGILSVKINMHTKIP